MAEFELLRGKPAILQLTRGRFIRLRFRLQEEPNELVTRLNARQSIGNKIETRPERSYSVWRLIQDQLTQQEADELRRLEQMSLERGESVELIRDDEWLFCLAGDVPQDQRRGVYPRTPLGVRNHYTLSPWSGQYALGSIGVWPSDAKAGTNGIPTTAGHGVLLNGDFVDGDLGAVPTDWTSPGSATVAVEKSLYLPAAGKGSYSAKIYGKDASGGEALRQDVTLETAVKDSIWYNISILARADRDPSSTVTGLLQVYLGPADGSHSMVKIGECTPTAEPEWFYFSKDLSVFNLATNPELRISLRVSAEIANSPVQLFQVIGENKRWFTGLIPKSSERVALDGTRPNDQILKYINYLAYASQVPAQVRGDRWGFTVDFWFAPGWSAADIPDTEVTLYQDSDESYAFRPGLKIKAGDTAIYATASLDNGSTIVAQSDVTWTANVWQHFAVTFQESSNPGSTTDGVIKLAVDGGAWSAGGTHNKRSGAQRAFILIGSEPSSAANHKTATGRFHHLRQTGFYLDDTTEGRKLTDFYSATIPPSRLRVATRAVLSPQQRGSIVKFEKNNYRLDATFIETRNELTP